jgi:2-polyprenyl-6-methoxyphenol hydroxylase-like FAD-dependent oxidoreductase
MEQFDVAVIGAGAAGMMCAAVAAQRGRTVVLIEHATVLAEKSGFRVVVAATSPTNKSVRKISFPPTPIFANRPWQATRRRTFSI